MFARNLHTITIFLHRSCCSRHPTSMTEALKHHWPEYLIEAICLGLFMISAFSFATLLEHPSSPVHQAIANSTLRRFLMGLAMGGTAIAIIYSPWGQQSGAHINPSTTLTFFRLGKVARWDAVFYIAGQFLGGAVGAARRSKVASSLGGARVGQLRRDHARSLGAPRRVRRRRSSSPFCS